jgi:hypothetical protein
MPSGRPRRHRGRLGGSSVPPAPQRQRPGARGADVVAAWGGGWLLLPAATTDAASSPMVMPCCRLQGVLLRLHLPAAASNRYAPLRRRAASYCPPLRLPPSSTQMLRLPAVGGGCGCGCGCLSVADARRLAVCWRAQAARTSSPSASRLTPSSSAAARLSAGIAGNGAGAAAAATNKVLLIGQRRGSVSLLRGGAGRTQLREKRSASSLAVVLAVAVTGGA